MTVNDVLAVEKIRDARDSVYKEIGKVVFGQQKVVEKLLVSLIAGGHCLIVGVPGLARLPAAYDPTNSTIFFIKTMFFCLA